MDVCLYVCGDELHIITCGEEECEGEILSNVNISVEQALQCFVHPSTVYP